MVSRIFGWACYMLRIVCIAVLAVSLRVEATAIGFCRDNVPTGLVDTGFAAVSGTPQGTCDPSLWCGLRADTKEWTTDEHGTINYYVFSACCSGTQGQFLHIDSASGLPTCTSGEVASSCTRTDWHNKFMHDFIDKDTSGQKYDFQVTPSTLISSPYIYGGTNASRACSCGPDHPGCQRQSADGTICLICATNDPCSDDVVEFNLNFFKIHSVDLKTSELSFAVWVRQIWYDKRLSYDYQCYGGLEYFEAFAEAGSIENSQIWTPDVALYNGESDIWQGSIAPRQASIWSCWDMLPTRGGCGYVYWARPGILKALCKYGGLVKFPFDSLECQLEFAPWGIDGRFQDLIPRKKDGGIEFACAGCEAVTGLTAGTQFQDYVIDEIRAERIVVRYPSSPSALWPELLYTVKFTRSKSFYEIQLVMPGCLLSCLSFIVFWMNPAVTDRLGFGCTVMLAMITNQIVATQYMPVCEERVLMDYMSIAFVVFGAISLLETGIVLYLSSLQVDDWVEAFVPYVVRKCFVRDWFGESQAKPTKKVKKRVDFADKSYQLRRQLYHQIFYAMDRDFSGSLSLEEIEEFGVFILGSKWDIAQSKQFMLVNDDSFDGSLNFEEFAYFCEGNLLKDYQTDLPTLKAMIKGFLVVISKKLEAKALMWKLRALQLDQFCRWAIPPGFAFFFVLATTLPESALEGMSKSKGSHAALILSGLYPIMLIFLTAAVFYFARSRIIPAQGKGLKLFRSKGSSEEDGVIQGEVVADRDAEVEELINIGRNFEAVTTKPENLLRSDETTYVEEAYGFDDYDYSNRGPVLRARSPPPVTKAPPRPRPKPSAELPRAEYPSFRPEPKAARVLRPNAGAPMLVPLASSQNQEPRRHAQF